MSYLGVPSIATMFSIVYFLTLFYPSLHVSALMGHLQMEYTQSFMEAIMPTTDPFLSYTLYTYILVLASCYVIHCFYIYN
jgi:hypothetical protein